MKKQVNKIIIEMERQGVIEESTSSWVRQ